MKRQGGKQIQTFIKISFIQKVFRELFIAFLLDKNNAVMVFQEAFYSWMQPKAELI